MTSDSPAPSAAIPVTCAIIRDGNAYLVAQRSEGSHLAGQWEFPGGKQQTGESPEACIVREIREELGVDIEALERLPATRHRYAEKTIELIPLVCRIVRGTPSALEHKQILWIEETELADLVWCEADLPIVDSLLGGAAEERTQR